MEAAVRRKAEGRRTGAFLSGGTDSSTVAGMLGRVLGRPAPTFSIGFDAAGYDERAYARIAAKHFGTEHHEHYVARVPLVRKAVSYVRQAKVPLLDRLDAYNLLLFLFLLLLLRLGVADVFTPEFLRAIDEDAPRDAQRAVWAEAAAGSVVNRMLAYDWRYTLADNDLPKVCGTTALAGIDVGFPLLSDELLDFSLRLAPALKLKGLKLRWFFKAALRGFLSEEILRKKKHGFGLPFGVWLARHAGLQALARESFASLGKCGIVRAAFLDELLDRKLVVHPGYYGEMVWLLVVLEQWLGARAAGFALRP